MSATIHQLHTDSDHEHDYDAEASAAAYAAAKDRYNRENTGGVTWDDLSRSDKLPLWQAAFAEVVSALSSGDAS